MNFSLSSLLRDNFYHVLIAFAIFLFIQGFILFYQESIKTRLDLNRRLRATILSSLQEQALEELLLSRGLTHKGQLRYPFMRRFNEMIVRSGTTIGVVPIIFGMIVFGLLSAILLWALAYRVVVIFPISIVTAILIPIFILKFLTRRRIQKFGKGLPDAISMISRSLRVGHPLPVAIRMVGREMSEPVGTEFAIVSNELAAGLALDQAIKNLEARVGQEDLPMLVAAIVIQSDTGGNLGEILNVLSSIIRSRMKLRRKVHALTSEGRMSARVLSALPFILYCVFKISAPDYYGVAWQDDATELVLSAGAIWMLIGNLVMMKMVDIKY